MPEILLAWVCLVAIVAAAAASFSRHHRATFALLLVAGITIWLAAIVRIIATGHLPKFGTFEESISSAAVILAHAVFLARRPERALPASVAAVVAGLLLLHGLAFPTGRYPLTISELSFWLDLHVVAAWFTASAFALATGGGVWLLRGGGKEAESLLARSLQVGFLFQSIMMLFGAWYGTQLFGKAFSFDPIELLALISWIATASVLHLHAYRGLRGSALAALGLLASALLFVSFRLIVHLSKASSYHIIDLQLRLHG